MGSTIASRGESSNSKARDYSPTDSFARRATEKEFHFDFPENAQAFEQDARLGSRLTGDARRLVKPCQKSSKLRQASSPRSSYAV